MNALLAQEPDPTPGRITINVQTELAGDDISKAESGTGDHHSSKQHL